MIAGGRSRRDPGDAIGGAILAVAGGAIALHAGLSYPLGTLRAMGPGMFPTAVGALIFLLGLAIGIPALLRAGPPLPPLEIRTMLTTLAAPAAFALIVQPFGLVPAIIALTLVSSSADSRLGIVGKLVLGAALALLCFLVFRVGLGLHMQPFRWPF